MREGAEEGLGSRACSTAGEDYLSFWISGVPQYGELIATSMSKTQRGMSILGNRGIFLLSVAPNGRCERDKSYHERKAVENCIHPRVLYAPIEFQRMEVYGTVSNLGGFERVIRQAVPIWNARLSRSIRVAARVMPVIAHVTSATGTPYTASNEIQNCFINRYFSDYVQLPNLVRNNLLKPEGSSATIPMTF